MIFTNTVIAAFSEDADTRLEQVAAIIENAIKTTSCKGGYTMQDGTKVQDDGVLMSQRDFSKVARHFADQESVLSIDDRHRCHIAYNFADGDLLGDPIGQWAKVPEQDAMRSAGHTQIGQDFYTAV